MFLSISRATCLARCPTRPTGSSYLSVHLGLALGLICGKRRKADGMADETKVQWPGKVVNVDGDDLKGPVRDLVDGLDLLKVPPPAEKNTAAGIIGSTTLELTNQVKQLVTLAGGGAAVVGAIGSGWSAVEDNTALSVTLAGGVSLVLASMIVALSVIMNGDVRGRAAATVEQLKSRATVAAAFVNSAADQLKRELEPNQSDADGESHDPVVADLRTAFALGKPVVVETIHGTSGRVVELRWTQAAGLRLKLDKGDDISPSEVQEFNAR